MLLEKGTLWQRIVTATQHAIDVGALLPIPTDHIFIEDSGMRFFVRVLANLQRKDEARKKQDSAAQAGKSANPFLPPEQDLVVADITDTHLAILNKFNVVEHHLLVITRHYEDQDTLLTQGDFEALWLCMAEYPGLGFYNGGREAGASQQHKHLQIVPVPLAPEGPAIPLEPLLPETKAHELSTIPRFPFLHSFVRLHRERFPSPLDAARETFELYGVMLRSLGLNSPEPSRLAIQSVPYCFLMTREWMLLVPRETEFFKSISFNSLAFAGSLFVRNEDQLARLKSYGPMRALRQVTLRKEQGGAGASS